jgi:hypothetical protein
MINYALIHSLQADKPVIHNEEDSRPPNEKIITNEIILTLQDDLDEIRQEFDNISSQLSQITYITGK